MEEKRERLPVSQSVPGINVPRNFPAFCLQRDADVSCSDNAAETMELMKWEGDGSNGSRIRGGRGFKEARSSEEQ